DAHPDRTGGDERIEDELLRVEETHHIGDGLVGEVAADDAAIGNRIVRLPDIREQQQLHVENRIGAEKHQISGLFPFLTAAVDEGDAGRPAPARVEIDARDLALIARREIGLAHQNRQDGRLRTRFRVISAAEPLAEPAIAAGSLTHAEGVAVSLREIARGLRKRLVAKLACRLGEERVAEGLLLRRVRIGPGARTLERIAALEDLSLRFPAWPQVPQRYSKRS